MAQSNIFDVPVGANKRFLVTCNGGPFAGFDTHNQASLYVTMQKNKTKKGGAPAEAAGKDWNIKDTQG